MLLHATPLAMEPVRLAMVRAWPEAEAVNLLNDRLTIDRAREGEALSDSLTARFVDFGRYAQRIGADGILITCSAFGQAIDVLAAELRIPLLKPNEAMFREAIAAGRRIWMLATFAPSVATMDAEFRDFAAKSGQDAVLDTMVVDDAIDLLRGGDNASHNRLVAAPAPRFADHGAAMLAHFWPRARRMRCVQSWSARCCRHPMPPSSGCGR